MAVSGGELESRESGLGDRGRRQMLADGLRGLEEPLQRYGVWVAFAILFVVSASVSSSFLHTANLLNIGRQSVPLGIVALGEAIVILVGGIDVSVGAVVTLTTCIAARVMAGSDGRVGPTVALVLAMAVGVGLANGVLISILGTDAFVTTLATMLLVQGAALVYTQGSPANDLTHGFRQISEGDFLGIPISIYCFAGLVVALWLVLSRTVWGHRIYAVGTNAVTTRLSAQPVVTTVIAAYVACSVLAAVGGLFLVARLGTGDTAAGSGWELKAISAVLIGGIPFGGGRGSILGPVGGVLVLVTLLNLVDLLALPNYSTLIVNGAAIIVGVALYSRHRSP